MKLVIMWLPRALAIILTVLVLMFSIDSMGTSEWFIPLVAAVPGMVILIATVIAWRAPFLGGVIFIALGSSYAYQAYLQDGFSNIGALMLLTVIPVLAGILFLLQRPNQQFLKPPPVPPKAPPTPTVTPPIPKK
jgi:hypothetical protein